MRSNSFEWALTFSYFIWFYLHRRVKTVDACRVENRFMRLQSSKLIIVIFLACTVFLLNFVFFFFFHWPCFAFLPYTCFFFFFFVVPSLDYLKRKRMLTKWNTLCLARRNAYDIAALLKFIIHCFYRFATTKYVVFFFFSFFFYFTHHSLVSLLAYTFIFFLDVIRVVRYKGFRKK